MRLGWTRPGADCKLCADNPVGGTTKDIMSAAIPRPKSVAEYIGSFPPEVQTVLEKVRLTIREAAPEAQEIISYQMPAFKLHRILVYFAAWKAHIGLYPPVTGDPGIQKAVAPYAGPKGNLQFPLSRPIPYDLIRRIVKLRVKQDRANAAAKRAKRRRS